MPRLAETSPPQTAAEKQGPSVATEAIEEVAVRAVATGAIEEVAVHAVAAEAALVAGEAEGWWSIWPPFCVLAGRSKRPCANYRQGAE